MNLLRTVSEFSAFKHAARPPTTSINWRLMFYPRPGGRMQRAITRAAPIPLALAAAAAVACSPSAPSLVFTSDRDGNLELYTITSDGRSEQNVTNSQRDEYSPRVSPNGRLVAFQSGSGADVAIEVMGLDGSDRTRLTTGPGLNRSHRWSPDSTRLAYVVEVEGADFRPGGKRRRHRIDAADLRCGR